MLALTVIPGDSQSARVEQVPEPKAHSNHLLIKALALGLCGTDIEILRGEHGSTPKGSQRLVLGHESLGEVLEAPEGSGFEKGDRVVGIVRRPDPVPCENCARGEWDMCRNGLYTERGIKEAHGYGSERWTIRPEFAVRVDPALELNAVLLEPASILAKAWRHIEEIGRRARWHPCQVLVTGAGPVGLLAALMAQQRNLEVTVIDLVRTGAKPALVADLGGRYHVGRIAELRTQFDVILECTGGGELVLDSILSLAPNGVLCLTGLSGRKRNMSVDLTGVNRSLVLENQVVFGSVNAARRDYETAAAALRAADQRWLERMISIRVPLTEWKSALGRPNEDIKAVIEFNAG